MPRREHKKRERSPHVRRTGEVTSDVVSQWVATKLNRKPGKKCTQSPVNVHPVKHVREMGVKKRRGTGVKKPKASLAKRRTESEEGKILDQGRNP